MEIIYRIHAIQRMFERDISEETIENIIRNGNIIEEYNNDKPYPSYLILGFVKEKPIHIVYAENADQIIIITTYIPESTKWENNYQYEDKKMKCMICKHGETVSGTTTITLERASSTVVFKDVPALVCNNCGEKYVDQKTTKSLLKKASEIVENGVEVDIRKFKVAA